MYLHGIEIYAGESETSVPFLSCLSVAQFAGINFSCHVFWLGCARIFPLFYVATKLMWRTDRWRQRWSHSTGKRISNTMRYLQRATTTLRSHFSIWLGSFQGNVSFSYLWILFVMWWKLYICIYKMSAWLVQWSVSSLRWVTSSCSPRSSYRPGCTTIVSEIVNCIF